MNGANNCGAPSLERSSALRLSLEAKEMARPQFAHTNNTPLEIADDKNNQHLVFETRKLVVKKARKSIPLTLSKLIDLPNR